MNNFQFLLSYLILIFVSGFFCNGWYIITRGAMYDMPDGTKKYEGMIFGRWQIFWEKILNTYKVFYNEENTFKKFIELQIQDKNIASKFICEGKTDYLFLTDKDISDKEFLRMQHLLSCKIDVSGNMFSLYIEQYTYRFPIWMQKIFSSCITCYSSVYGSLIYCSFVAIQKNAFIWCQYKGVAYFIFWILFIISLSYVSPLFNAKIKR